MVSKARLDLPEPDRPVITSSESRGISRSMPLRLCARAPEMTIRSATANDCRSRTGVPGRPSGRPRGCPQRAPPGGRGEGAGRGTGEREEEPEGHVAAVDDGPGDGRAEAGAGDRGGDHPPERL